MTARAGGVRAQLRRYREPMRLRGEGGEVVVAPVARIEWAVIRGEVEVARFSDEAVALDHARALVGWRGYHGAT